MKKYKTAAILMIIHGGVMEIGGCLMLLPALASNAVDNNMFSFIVPYLQENLHLMTVMGGIYGVIRIIGAIGLLNNRMWGLVLSIINCVITMALMIFMLPAGIIDGMFAGTSLILILTQFFGKERIVKLENKHNRR